MEISFKTWPAALYCEHPEAPTGLGAGGLLYLRQADLFRKGTNRMSVFLESYLGLAILAAIAGICVCVKAMTAGRYRRIARQMERMDTTKDKTVRKWRLQFEELSSVRNGVANVAVFSERCLQRYRRFGITLRRWNALAHAGIWLTLLLGMVMAFGAYWYRLDYRYMILYASAGVVFAGAAILSALLVDVASREDQALVALQNYLENELQPALAAEGPIGSARNPIPPRNPRPILEPEEEKVLKEVFQEYLT